MLTMRVQLMRGGVDDVLGKPEIIFKGCKRCGGELYRDDDVVLGLIVYKCLMCGRVSRSEKMPDMGDMKEQIRKNKKSK
jgi:hypothetical protein